MSIIKTFPEFSSLLAKLNISAVYLFIGNGAKLQYASMSKVKTVLAPTIDHLNCKHGAGRWLAVYGGDTWVEDKPDLGACMHWVKQEYNPPMVAVQGWEECDKFVDYVYKYEEEKDVQGRTMYGGVKEGALVGGTKVYLGEQFRGLLTGIVNIDARGRVGTQELQFARQVGVEILQVEPAEPRNEY
eukprot:GFUD01131067.1.p1 GENE.GFUD01131067.1~~GFUD01131067.1.p1  ORF type:complete len:186 (-),score=72.08 GFUD01131067.1:200-757(-)